MSRDTAEAATAHTSEVHSEADAIKWMVEGVYLVEGESVTAKKLSHIMLQIAASIPKLTKQGANALRAAAFILEGLTVEQEGKAIGDAVGAHFGAVLREQLKAVKDTTAEMAKHGEAMATAADAVREMLAQEKAQGTDNTTGNDTQLADAVGNVLARTEEAVRILKEEKEQRATQMTYAAKVRGNAPSNYEQAALVAKGNLLDRQVVVRKAHDAESDQLASLTERELVQKATVVMELMGIAASDRPMGMKFIGARRTQSGMVIYTLDATASADYLRRDDVMRSFMGHFGGTSALHVRAYQVVVEHVPITFDVTSTDVLRRAEEASGLPPRAIYEARWIKPTQLRGQGQKVAFLIMGFSSRETANHAMNYGVVLEGKHCRTRKLLPEPKRCVKCQGYGHFARECKSTKDVCARCAGEHRTTDQDRPAGKGQTTRCANCNRTGHGAADRSCDEYKRRLAQMRARDPDSKFRLFPTDNPDTWGRAEGHAPMDEFDDAWRNDQRDWTQKDPPPHRGGPSGRERGGAGTRPGGRGGAARGRGRTAAGESSREAERGQTTVAGGGAPARLSQQSTGNLRQQTLAETWTNSGGRMGAFRMHSPTGWDDAPANSQGTNCDSIANFSVQPNTHTNTNNYTTNTFTPNPDNPPLSPTNNGAASCDPETHGETLPLATKREQDPTYATRNAGNSGERLRLHTDTGTIYRLQRSDTSERTLHHGLPAPPQGCPPGHPHEGDNPCQQKDKHQQLGCHLDRLPRHDSTRAENRHRYHPHIQHLQQLPPQRHARGAEAIHGITREQAQRWGANPVHMDRRLQSPPPIVG